MKLKSLEDELNFLSESSFDVVKDYIETYSLRVENEAFFMDKFPELVNFYLSKHGICMGCGKKIIRTGNMQLIEALLKTPCLRYNAENLFFEVAEYATIIEWLKENDSVLYPEKDIFWSGDNEEILDFIRQNEVSKFGQYDLIKKRNNVAIKEMILCGRLFASNKLEIMLHGVKEHASLILSLSDCTKHYVLYKQIFDIRFKGEVVIRKLITKQLKAIAESLFFEIGDIKLVASYGKHFSIYRYDERILKRSNRDGMIWFLSKNRISKDAELLLFNQGRHQEIKAYLKSHELDDSSEVRLIKRGHHREIMLYLKHHSLCLEAQRELLHRGNSVEIIEFVSNYPVADEIYYELIKRNYCDEIDALNEFMMKQPCLY